MSLAHDCGRSAISLIPSNRGLLVLGFIELLIFFSLQSVFALGDRRRFAMKSIDDTLNEISGLLASMSADSSVLGYFPALYRRVTLKVRAAVLAEEFDDGERMARLVVVFAQRYLDAYSEYRSNGTCSQSWLVAFQCETGRGLTVLQHLLLGMNAHIGLDLGVAAAEVAGADVLSIRGDFVRINAILGNEIDDTQARLTRIFRPLGLIDRLCGEVDERLSLFSIAYARDKAWSQCLELVLADEVTKRELILERDLGVSRFSAELIRPSGFGMRLLLKIVRSFERGDVRTRIQILGRVRG